MVANEKTMESVGVCLRDWGLYYTGIVLNSVNETDENTTIVDSTSISGDTGLDGLMTYKIRMSPDLVCKRHNTMCDA
jgi:hypothetical protein